MNPPPFSLRQLQYAVAVAEARSFSRAAERCHVSQPSLSAQLALLEETLGVKLFERDRGGVLPTPAGEALVERARRVLADADDLAAAARQLTDPLRGTLRIGVIPTISPYLLPELVQPMRRAYPELNVLWVEEKTETLVRELQNAKLDAILIASVPASAELERATIAEDPFVLAGPVGHPMLKPKAPLKLHDLEGEPMLLLEDGHCLRDQALSLCSRAHAREADFRATSLPTLARMASGGAGLTLLPSISVATENRMGGLATRRFTEPAPKRTLILAWRKGSPLSDALKQIAETMREAHRGA